MPSPEIAEGFYWARIKPGTKESDVRGKEAFVAQRFAGMWFEPGEPEPISHRCIELLSQRLVPPEGAEAIPRAVTQRSPRTYVRRS